MKKEIQLIAAVLLLLASCKPVELQQMDHLDRQVMVHTDSTVLRAVLLEQDAKPQADKHRRYYWYQSGRINSSHAGWSGRLLDGAFTVKDRDTKMLLEQGNYDKGLRTGEWISWNDDGSIRQIQQYRNGILKVKKLPDSNAMFSRIKRYVRAKLKFKKAKK